MPPSSVQINVNYKAQQLIGHNLYGNFCKNTNSHTVFSSLYRAIEQDIEVIRPTICTRAFLVLKSLQF